jgi:Glycosyltransferase family 87
LADRRGWAYASVVVVLLALNAFTFVSAYPETLKLDTGCCAPQSGPLARDFSAYYIGSWRLLHDPAQVYTKGYLADGEPAVLPQPQRFKYLPSFLVMLAPLLLLPYQPALTAFDVFQFLLLPLIAVMLYEFTKQRGLLASSIVAAAVLFQPSALPSWGLSASYYWQWAEGQAKVLVAFMLVLSLYLAKTGRPGKAGIALGLAAFDPRFALLALPLFAAYTKGRWRPALGALIATAALSNFAFLLPGVGAGFVQMIGSGGASTPLYYYAWIPMIAVLSITAVEWRRLRELFGRPWTPAHAPPSEGIQILRAKSAPSAMLASDSATF